MSQSPTKPLFSEDTTRAIDAMHQAHFIAFAPYIWEVSMLLRERGILHLIENSDGLTIEEIGAKQEMSHYGIRILLEAGLGIGLIYLKEEKYHLTKTGYFFLNSDAVNVNYKFMKDICYPSANKLEESILNSKPEGLKTLGPWDTVYEGLSQLPGDAKKSWFDFDHFYSDTTFDEILPIIFENQPKSILDIGGNTGKWALKCLAHDPNVRVGIVDLEGQINVAKKNIEATGYSDRVDFYVIDMLNPESELPKGYDIIWMSQFLDCFSDSQIVSVLEKCRDAANENSLIYINETFWDLQRFETTAFILQMTSLYFTIIANGTSQMYDSKVFIKFTEEAGMELLAQSALIGHAHTLLKLRKRR